MYFFIVGTSSSPTPVVATLMAFSAMAAAELLPPVPAEDFLLSPPSMPAAGSPPSAPPSAMAARSAPPPAPPSPPPAGVADVHPHDVAADHPVAVLVADVPNEEDEVEPGQDGAHEVDLLGRALRVVVPSEGAAVCEGGMLVDQANERRANRFRKDVHLTGWQRRGPNYDC
ncbi:hypothetical protein THAOC_16758 [Thalassiosira oceanica]|uniref:Uncharacterized protein n=1 Tax=Thalassiosira oceanica TaxID=159749 RepID=K0SBE0_THAOC|nr:hypothetical protein THAOC_16758 [Thalassiosira oceanica]|eukprot:EJK62620.1 hypothetical protein THAOC_16758 [Thalassiosira oceanica]